MATEEGLEGPDFLVQAITTYLDGGQSSEVREMIEDPGNKDHLIAAAWDLASVFCKYIDQSSYEAVQGVYEVSLEGLELLSEIAKPKEVILVLLEHAELFNDDTKYYNLLRPAQKCLLRMGPKKANSIGFALETLYAYLLTVELPSFEELEGDEKKLLDLDPKIKRVLEVTNALVRFVEPFCKEVKELRQKEDTSKIAHRQAKEITRYLLRLFEHPVASLDVTLSEGEVGGDAHVLTKFIMDLMNILQPNVHSCVENLLKENNRIQRSKKKASGEGEDSSEYDGIEPYTEAGLAVYVYLAYGERLAPNNIPHVYTPQHVFEFCHRHCQYLLKADKTLVTIKGVLLLRSIINCIPTQSLPWDYVESEFVIETVSALSHVAVHCSVKEVRQAALKVFPQLLDKFGMKGRNRFIKYLINRSQHAGLAGYAIHLLKEELNQTLSLCIPSEYFVGHPLREILQGVFSLPDGATTDILDQRDKILAALNLLRFLILRDSLEKNVTGIWDLMPSLQKTYCDPLRTGLNMSQAHYKMELQNLKENPHPKNANSGPEMTLTVGGMQVPGLTPEQNREVLEAGLVNLDMIDSVLGRVCELIDAKPPHSKK